MMSQYSAGSGGEEARNRKKGENGRKRRGQEEMKRKTEFLQCTGRVRDGCT